MTSSPRAARSFTRKLSQLNLGAVGLPSSSFPAVSSPLSVAAQAWLRKGLATTTGAAEEAKKHVRFFSGSSLASTGSAASQGGAAAAFSSPSSSLSPLSSSKPLYCKVLGEGRGGNDNQNDCAFIAHGLLGSQRNFTTWARSFSEATGVCSFGLDLRGHGNSGSAFPSPHTLASASGDVLATARAVDRWPRVMVGHSMGGKVLLNLLATPDLAKEFLQDRGSGQRHHRRLQVFILDSFPGTKTHNSDHESPKAAAGSGSGSGPTNLKLLDGVETVLSIVASAPHPIPSRQWVMDKCAAAGLDRATSMWLASNLIALDGHHHGHSGPHIHKTGSASPSGTSSSSSSSSSAGGFRWIFDPLIASSLFADYLKVDLWPLLTDKPQSQGNPKGLSDGVDLYMVTASRSTRWKDDETQALIRKSKETFSSPALSSDDARSGKVHWLSIQAGHWVHADNPKGLLDLVVQCLREEEAKGK